MKLIKFWQRTHLGHTPTELLLRLFLRVRSSGHLGMLFAIAWILPIAEAANESGCQASSAYGLLAGYSPTTNISDVALIDLEVRNLGTETNSTLALSIYETGGNYSLQALSTQAKALMFDCAVGCPLKHYQMYFGAPPPQPPPPPRLRHRLTPVPPPSPSPPSSTSPSSLPHRLLRRPRLRKQVGARCDSADIDGLRLQRRLEGEG